MDGFLRYVRWVTDGSIADGPVVLIDLIARQQALLYHLFPLEVADESDRSR